MAQGCSKTLSAKYKLSTFVFLSYNLVCLKRKIMWPINLINCILEYQNFKNFLYQNEPCTQRPNSVYNYPLHRLGWQLLSTTLAWHFKLLFTFIIEKLFLQYLNKKILLFIQNFSQPMTQWGITQALKFIKQRSYVCWK